MHISLSVSKQFAIDQNRIFSCITSIDIKTALLRCENYVDNSDVFILYP